MEGTIVSTAALFGVTACSITCDLLLSSDIKEEIVWYMLEDLYFCRRQQQIPCAV